MAIFSLSLEILSRSKKQGQSAQSAIAKAAYNARECLINENTGERYDFRDKGKVMFSGIFIPNNSPPWIKDISQNRQALWSLVENRERRKDSQLAREFRISLPHELNDTQRLELAKKFVWEAFVRHGMIADLCIHPPRSDGDQRNYHAHILVTMRGICRDNFGKKERDWNKRSLIQEWRQIWENFANRCLERHGHKERIDRRSLKEQGIDREPTIHLGPIVSKIEKAGRETKRGNKLRAIEERNRQREQLKTVENRLSERGNSIQHQFFDDKEERLSLGHDDLRGALGLRQLKNLERVENKPLEGIRTTQVCLNKEKPQDRLMHSDLREALGLQRSKEESQNKEKPQDRLMHSELRGALGLQRLKEESQHSCRNNTLKRENFETSREWPSLERER